MKLLLVNPNTTASMTAKMREAAGAVASPGIDIVAVTAEYGPENIEGYYDEVFSVPAMLDVVRAHPDAAGVVVGCFDDTGVDAARCVTSAPVIGLCQAAMQVASIVSGGFTVVTTLGRSVPALEHLARRHGYADLCRRVRASEIPVLALEDPASGAHDRLRTEVRRALDEDGCEAIVLGCAGMVDMARALSEEFAVPVIEGVTAAVKIVESLAALGITTSKRGGYAPPRAKTYTGAFSRYGPA
ncbi:MAG: aspartate/glutamate racemase family protein [Thiotrichales bacterium]|nr:aspartate/glutamate racemase family protein [Thiotrichales bacterium]